MAELYFHALKTLLLQYYAAELMLFEDEYALEGPIQCQRDGVQTTGYNIIAKGTTTAKKITNGAVTFTPKEGNGAAAPTQNLGNGRYQANYTTGTTPAKNLIEAWGETSVTIPEILYDPILNQNEPYPTVIYYDKVIKKCIGNIENNDIRKRTITLRSSQYGVFYKDTSQQIFGPQTPFETAKYTVYGVDAALKIEPAIVLLSDKGNSTSDTMFTYTILPPEYNAVDATIDLWKSEPNQNVADSWDGYVTGDQTQGTGATGLIRGTTFDINRRYEAQVVLNYGTDMEVRGEKISSSSSIASYRDSRSCHRNYKKSRFLPTLRKKHNKIITKNLVKRFFERHTLKIHQPKKYSQPSHDGAAAAKFLTRLVGYLEDPASLFIESA